MPKLYAIKIEEGIVELHEKRPHRKREMTPDGMKSHWQFQDKGLSIFVMSEGLRKAIEKQIRKVGHAYEITLLIKAKTIPYKQESRKSADTSRSADSATL